MNILHLLYFFIGLILFVVSVCMSIRLTVALVKYVRKRWGSEAG